MEIHSVQLQKKNITSTNYHHTASTKTQGLTKLYSLITVSIIPGN